VVQDLTTIFEASQTTAIIMMSFDPEMTMFVENILQYEIASSEALKKALLVCGSNFATSTP